MEERNPNKVIDYILSNSAKYAKAKSDRIYLEEYRKSLKALLMKRSTEDTLGAQEREAYAHEEYRQLLEGIRDAVEIEEKLRWDLVAAQAAIEVWKAKYYVDSRTDRSVS